MPQKLVFSSGCTMSEENTLKLYTDGGARDNPGEAGCGFVIIEGLPGAEKILKKCGKYLGQATNNQAEYMGVIEGLRWINKNLPHNNQITIYMDSNLVVQQLNGVFKVKTAHLKSLWTDAHNLLKKFISFKIEHIPRDENSQADELANLAMDNRSDITL